MQGHSGWKETEGKRGNPLLLKAQQKRQRWKPTERTNKTPGSISTCWVSRYRDEDSDIETRLTGFLHDVTELTWKHILYRLLLETVNVECILSYFYLNDMFKCGDVGLKVNAQI